MMPEKIDELLRKLDDVASSHPGSACLEIRRDFLRAIVADWLAGVKEWSPISEANEDTVYFVSGFKSCLDKDQGRWVELARLTNGNWNCCDPEGFLFDTQPLYPPTHFMEFTAPEPPK